MEKNINSYNHCYSYLKKDNQLTSLQIVSNSNIPKLLELLNIVDDIDMHVKIFTLLTSHIISHNDSSDIIITCNYIYYKIQSLLNKTRPKTTTRMLYFLSALLYTEEEEVFTRKKSLVIYAQNMIRNSGCLLAMCNLFISSMMQQETWKALCKCLADTCQNSHENQTYCSHLIPLSVEKGARGDSDVIVTLKSLISNHKRNMQLFLDCNGMALFNKELLRYDTSMQLLDLLAQELAIENLEVLYEIVCEHLNYFKREYPDSQYGQWATLILYHMKSRLKGSNILFECNEVEKHDYGISMNKADNERSFNPVTSEVNGTINLLQNVIREIYQFNANNVKRNPLTEQKSLNVKDKKSSWNQNINGSAQRNFNSHNMFRDSSVRPMPKTEVKEPQNDLSFSFLLNRHHSHSEYINKSMLISPQKPEKFKNEQAKRNSRETVMDVTFRSYINSSIKSRDRFEDTINRFNNTKNFKPNFASTPNQTRYFESKTMNSTKLSQMSRMSNRTMKKVNSGNRYRKFAQRRTQKIDKCKQNASQQRSISSRFFDAINDSCTTIVKTVKNIFTKVDKEMKPESLTPSDERAEASCSYSFTDYMRKRDAMLADKTIHKSVDNEAKNVQSCKTCNDTRNLQRKADNNDLLKSTINKLKLGINLYGCDFKKISRTMYPHENYMTPEVLYSLYRRVILK